MCNDLKQFYTIIDVEVNFNNGFAFAHTSMQVNSR